MKRTKLKWRHAAAGTALIAMAYPAGADDRADYQRRAAAEDVRLFQSLDRNGDGALAREEVTGDLNLGPRFNDMDINRNGVVTPEEFQRYLAQRYGGA